VDFVHFADPELEARRSKDVGMRATDIERPLRGRNTPDHGVRRKSK
jgi:hypothetical protein